MDAQRLEQIQRIFSDDCFVTDNSMVTEQVEEGYAKCWLEVQSHHPSAAGAIMEGAIFTLIDFVFAVVSSWNEPLHVLATFQIIYLSITRSTRLIVEARKVKGGRSTCYYLMEVKDDPGNEMAHMAANGFSKG